MAGISGIIGKKEFLVKNPSILKKMLQAQAYDNNYAINFFLDNDIGVQAGTVIHSQFNFSARITWNEQKDKCLLFFGEAKAGEKLGNISAYPNAISEYNYQKLLDYYETNGISILNYLKGIYCGLLIDYKENNIYLFNDVFGLSRIYYYEEDDDILYFSSEAKSILEVLPKTRSIDYKKLAEYFACNCTLGEETWYKGIYIMPPGSVWIFSGGKIKRKISYRHCIEEEEKIENSVEAITEKIRGILKKSVRRCYNENEQVAVALTGGLDTRLIMAFADFPPYKVPCFTFSGIYRDCLDAKIAKKLAEICQQKHEVFKITKSFFHEFPALAKSVICYTDGMLDVRTAAELFVLRKARDIAPIHIYGNFGDQLLRRVVGFSQRPLDYQIFEPEFTKYILEAYKKYDSLNKENPIEFFISFQLPWYHYSQVAFERTQAVVRLPYLDMDLINLFNNIPKKFKLRASIVLQLVYEEDPRLGRIFTDRGKRYPNLPIISNIKGLIRESIYKFEYLFDYGMPNWLAKHQNLLAADKFARLFVGRQKYYHYRMWYKNELSSYIREIMLSERALSRPYVNRKEIEKHINNHLSGKGNYTREITYLLTCELMQRYLIEKK